MNYYNQPEFDRGNLVNTDSIEIKRNAYNMHVLLCYTHNDEYFEATVREDGYVLITKNTDTIFEYERNQFNKNQDFVCVYTERVIQDLKAWINTNGLPDILNKPISISDIRYIEEHPALGKLAIECVVNDYSEISFGIDSKTMKINDFVFDEIPAALVQECADRGVDIEFIKKHNEINREISRQLNEFIQNEPYHPADSMLSYKMAYETQYLNFDFSEITRYDIPVSVEGEAGRLVINRKDSFWEACLFIHDEKWAKMEQNETPNNGGFAHMNDNDFLMRVITVFGFMKGIFIEVDDTAIAA